MFEDALRYPWQGDDALETIVVGGILSLLGVFVLPILVLYGYFVRVMADVAVESEPAEPSTRPGSGAEPREDAGAVDEGDGGDIATEGEAAEPAVPPGFDDWETLLVDGVKALVIGVAYSIVPTVIFVLSVLAFLVPATVSAGTDTAAPGILGVVVGLALMVLSGFAMLALAYLLPAGIAAFAKTGDFGAAFSVANLKAIGKDGDYATAWLVALGVNLVVNVVGWFAIATVVGVVLLPFVGFYGNVASVYAIGRGVRDVELPE